MASIQVYYEFADGTPWVAKALPEDWREKGESDAAFAQRCGLEVFQAADDGEGEFRAGNWSVMKEAPVFQPDPAPIPDPIRVLQAQVAALQAKVGLPVDAVDATAAGLTP